MFQARHCPALRQPQQHQQRHCDVRGDVGGGDIVIKWGEQGGGEERHNQGRAVAAALVFEENVIVGLIDQFSTVIQWGEQKVREVW